LEISKNGRIIAELRPKKPPKDAAWRKAHKDSVNFLREGLPLNVGKVTEDDKYGDADL
jgi:hypothetical protein